MFCALRRKPIFQFLALDNAFDFSSNDRFHVFPSTRKAPMDPVAASVAGTASQTRLVRDPWERDQRPPVDVSVDVPGKLCDPV